MLNYEAAACRTYDRVLAMSASEAAALQRWVPGGRIGFNNTGVDCEYFRPADVEIDVNTVVFAGYFRHQPNIDAALYFCRDVLPRLRGKIPALRVVLAGGEPPPAVQQLAADHCITVTGWVDDLRPVIARAAVFVAPIISGAGLRGKVIEAWAMGKPVVSTSLGVDGLRAEAGCNALMADTPADFADAVARLVCDRELRARLRASALVTAREHYDWSVTLRQLEQEYEAVLAARSTRSGRCVASVVAL